MNCVACELLRKKIRARNAPPHSCGRYKKGYIEPDHKDGYVKVLFHQRITQTAGASLYTLHAQWLNGYRVKRGTQKWFRNADHVAEWQYDTKKPEHELWLKESEYEKLAFV